MIFKVAPTFMSGIAGLQNMFGLSQNDMKIVDIANKVPSSLFPELKPGAP
jgi:hypothetical protein